MRSYKHPVIEAFTLERLFYALSDPTRLDIVRKLAGVDSASCAALDGGRPKSSMSHHFRILREAGLVEDLDFHSLRRSYVTHLVEDGYDAFFIQPQVGHEHAPTTSIYTGISPDYRARLLADATARMSTQLPTTET